VWWFAVPPRSLTHIGGGWYIQRGRPLAIESGTRFQTLYRKSSAGYLRVERLVHDYRFYPPDCVIYAAVREYRGPVFAACGDRREIGIMRSGTAWTLEEDGILRPAGQRVGDSANAEVVEQTRLKPIESIVAAAMRQPPRRLWSAAADVARDNDAVVPSVEPADRPSARADANSMTAHAQLVEKAKQGKIDVYFLGDSITRRWGALDYPELLAHWRSSFFGWNAADFGWGADKTQHILWRIEHGELAGVNPRVIVLQAGTNNVAALPVGGRAVAEVTRGITAIVEACRRLSPGSTMVLTAIFPRNDDMRLMPGIVRINENLARLADGVHVRFLNINGALADADGRLFEGMMNARDALHPTIRGYRVWADALRPILTEVLGPPAAYDRAPAPTGDPRALAGR
jgi:lysophospholipase L1-like esterase